MKILAIGGEAHTGHSLLMHGIADHLEGRGLSVACADADLFFRAVAHEALQLLHRDERVAANYSAELLHIAANSALEDSTPFRADRIRGNLQRPIISSVVSKIAEAKPVQLASLMWWEGTVNKSADEGADVLVIAGRNPVERILDNVDPIERDLTIQLNLLAVCGIDAAARRLLAAQDNHEPSETEIRAAAAHITESRNAGRNRRILPYCDPVASVIYDPDRSGIENIRTANSEGRRIPPWERTIPATIAFDVGTYDRAEMVARAAQLADAAMRLPQLVSNVS